MNRGHGRLMQAVIDAIAMEADDDQPMLTDERLRAVIFGRESLTLADRRLLARSAATRDRFAWLRHRERARALAAWRIQEIEPRPLGLLAAADSIPVVGPLRIAGEGYSIALTPVDLEGLEWHIALQVMPALLAATPCGFQLVDSDGLVWLSGHPDSDGVISGFWTHNEPLWERAHSTRLQILPM